MKYSFVLSLLLCFSSVNAQQHKTENVIVITLDGMRWQEIFGGIDSALMMNENYTREPDGLKGQFWSADAGERRKRLLPFFWTTIAAKGQLYGNRNIGNLVNVINSPTPAITRSLPVIPIRQ